VILLLFSNALVVKSNSGLMIVINKLVPKIGCLNFAMYNNHVAYNNENINHAYLVLKQKVEGHKMEIFIPELKKVFYGIQAFQDIDCTGRMKKGWFGVPKYAYGFSNNTRSRKFTKAKFQYNKKYNQKIITLRKFSMF
jgi:uncharacterized protein (DUF2141 family)